MNQGPKTLGQIRSEASEEYPNLLFEAPNAKSASARSSGGHVKNHQSAAGLGFFPMSKKQQYGEQMPLVAWLAIDTGKFVICYCRHGIEQGATFYRKEKRNYDRFASVLFSNSDKNILRNLFFEFAFKL